MEQQEKKGYKGNMETQEFQERMVNLVLQDIQVCLKVATETVHMLFENTLTNGTLNFSAVCRTERWSGPPRVPRGSRTSRTKRISWWNGFARYWLLGMSYYCFLQVIIEHCERPVWNICWCRCTKQSELQAFGTLLSESYCDIQIMGWFPKFLHAVSLTGCVGLVYLLQARQLFKWCLLVCLCLC